MLTHSVTVSKLLASTPRGATFANPFDRPAHVEAKAVERIDQRADSDTYGQPIITSLVVIMQLDRELVPGTKVEYRGDTFHVANSKHLEHHAAPSNSELGCVG